MTVDSKSVLRPFRRRLAMSALVVVTLGLGVGANAALLILSNQVLYGLPEHVEEPERLVGVSFATNYVLYQHLRERTRTLALAAHAQQEMALGKGADAVLINVECVSQPYFAVLGAEPSMGRAFTEGEETQGGAAVVVFADGLWRRLGGDAAELGRTVRIGGRDHTVIGVMPRGFSGVNMLPVDAWILLTGSPEACSLTGDSMLGSRRGSWLRTIGRIRPGFAFEAADAEVGSLAGDDELLDAVAPRRVSSRISPLYDRDAATRSASIARSQQARISRWLAAAGGAIFLVACLNVAGVLSVGMIERRRELAIRMQLGATRQRIIALLSRHVLVLTTLSGIVAVLVAIGVRLYVAEFFPLRPADALLGGRGLAAIGGFALLGGVVGGALPVLQGALATTAAGAMGDGYAPGSDASKLRSALLVGQVGLSFILLICACLFVRSVQILVDDPGYDWDRIVVATVDQQTLASQGREGAKALFNRLIARVVELPEVDAVSVGPAILASGGPGIVGGVSGVSGSWGVGAMLSPVSSDYFRTVGTTIIGGRSLVTAPDREEVVIDEHLARELWPNETAQTAVGKCVFVSGVGGSNCVEVVGVTQARRHQAITGGGMGEVFVALDMALSPSGGAISAAATTLLVRTSGPPSAAVERVVEAIYDAAPELPFVRVRPLAELVSVQTRSWRIGASLFGLLGGLAVLIAAVGVFGVQARWIRNRVAEIGVRKALGATTGEVVGGVLRRGLMLIVVGLALGGAVAFAITRYLQSLLFEISPNEPIAYAGAAVLVLATGLMGCVIPALRASAIDPAVALRGE
jgi:putative ABC transport system permease protein